MIRKTLILGTIAILTLAAVGSAASTRGSIRGIVTDDAGAPLPGVTVSVESAEALGGPWVDITGADGAYQISNLPPAPYTLRMELDGFAPQERPGVTVRVDRTTEVNGSLSPAEVSEAIVVTTEIPVLDPEQTGTERMYSTEYLEKASIGSANRSYQSVLQQTAGVTGGANPVVYGSTLGENAWLIDGISTTDPVTSTFGANFNFDAIQEIAFLTGGFDAEYGSATGGVINVVTKSGGNDFSGTVDVRYNTDDFYESGDHFDPDEQQTKFLNPGATLGGPIVRDKAWFFTAYEYTDSERTPTGSPTTRNFEGDYFLGKISYQLNESWLGVLKYATDPADIANANAGLLVEPEATRKQEQGGDIFQLNLDAVLTSNLYWDARIGINRQELNSFPNSGDLDTPAHFDDATGISSANYSNAQYSDRDRDEFRSSLTYYADDFLGGGHEIKGGLEYNDLFFRTENFTTGGGYSYTDRSGPRILFYSPNPGAAEFDGEMVGGFLQDTWRVMPRLTAKLGVRYDQVTFNNDVGTEVADLDKIQPRIGLAWDVFGDAKTIARFSAGRFMHPNALTLPSFTRVDQAPTFRYISCSRFGASFGYDPADCQAIFGGDTFEFLGFSADTWIMDPDGTDPNGFWLFDVFGSEPNEVDPNLDAMYNDQIILSVEHQLAPQTTIEVSYVDKETKDIFEDTCNGNLPTPTEGADCDFYVMTNLDQLRRDYRGYILRFETRAWDRLQLVGSYTYADSKASVEYTQNAGADFDVFPVHFRNRYGRDQGRHDVELNGFVDLPWALTLAFDADYNSGFVWTPVMDADPYSIEYVEPRGSREGDDYYQLDLQLTKGFPIGETSVQLIGSVFNVFSSENVTDVCDDVDGCGSFELGEAIEWQDPRRYEVGVRFEF